jgi:hypothetical protein
VVEAATAAVAAVVRAAAAAAATAAVDRLPVPDALAARGHSQGENPERLKLQALLNWQKI